MSEPQGKDASMSGRQMVVICVGVSTFADDLEKQHEWVKKVVRVDWRPPAGGDEEILKLLDRLLGS